MEVSLRAHNNNDSAILGTLFSLCVGDLDSAVTEQQLIQTFSFSKLEGLASAMLCSALIASIDVHSAMATPTFIPFTVVRACMFIIDIYTYFPKTILITYVKLIESNMYF